MEHIIRTNDIGLNSLHRKELTGRNLLQSSCVKNIVHTRHSVLDGLRIADISNIELDLFCRVRVLGLKLMAHIILLLFITGKDADFLEVRIKEMLQHSRTERTSTTCNHKGCVIKCRHFYFPLSFLLLYYSYLKNS